MWRAIASNALTLFIVGLIVLAGILAWGRQQYSGPGPLAEAICFKVEKGASLSQVSRALAEQGAVSDARIFRIGAGYSEKAGSLKFGSYLIAPGSSMAQVLDSLTVGGQSTCGREVNFRIGVAGADVVLRELDPATNRYVEVVKFAPATEPAPTEYLDAAQAPDLRWRITLAEGVTSETLFVRAAHPYTRALLPGGAAAAPGRAAAPCSRACGAAVAGRRRRGRLRLLAALPACR